MFLENNFTIPESRNAPAYIVEQPYFPQQYLLQPQFSPQQVGEQPSPNVSNSELNLSPSAPCLGKFHGYISSFLWDHF